MSATGSRDGDSSDYLDIAAAIRDLPGSVRLDLHDLDARAVAAVAFGNTDDHLRNHGFVAASSTWRLSPAFDINPTPDLGRRRATSIAGTDAFPDEIEGLFALADECGLGAGPGHPGASLQV